MTNLVRSRVFEHFYHTNQRLFWDIWEIGEKYTTWEVPMAMWLWASWHLTLTQTVNVVFKRRFLKTAKKVLIITFLLNWSKFLPNFWEIHLHFKASYLTNDICIHLSIQYRRQNWCLGTGWAFAWRPSPCERCRRSRGGRDSCSADSSAQSPLPGCWHPSLSAAPLHCVQRSVTKRNRHY